MAVYGALQLSHLNAERGVGEGLSSGAVSECKSTGLNFCSFTCKTARQLRVCDRGLFTCSDDNNANNFSTTTIGHHVHSISVFHLAAAYQERPSMPTEVEGTHQIGDLSLYTKTWKVSYYTIPAGIKLI